MGPARKEELAIHHAISNYVSSLADAVITLIGECRLRQRLVSSVL
jgi:hypothetical protein